MKIRYVYLLRPNPARVQAYKLSDAVPFLERHTGRAYFTGETPSDEDDEGLCCWVVLVVRGQSLTVN